MSRLQVLPRAQAIKHWPHRSTAAPDGGTGDAPGEVAGVTVPRPPVDPGNRAAFPHGQPVAALDWRISLPGKKVERWTTLNLSPATVAAPAPTVPNPAIAARFTTHRVGPEAVGLTRKTSAIARSFA